LVGELIFADWDRERLRAWLESGVEDGGTGMLFVAVRRSLSRIANDAELLARRAQSGIWVDLENQWPFGREGSNPSRGANNLYEKGRFYPFFYPNSPYFGRVFLG
jgi:hypothetical protein